MALIIGGYHSGGNHGNYYPGAIPFSQVIAIYSTYSIPKETVCRIFTKITKAWNQCCHWKQICCIWWKQNHSHPRNKQWGSIGPIKSTALFATCNFRAGYYRNGHLNHGAEIKCVEVGHLAWYNWWKGFNLFYNKQSIHCVDHENMYYTWH